MEPTRAEAMAKVSEQEMAHPWAIKLVKVMVTSTAEVLG